MDKTKEQKVTDYEIISKIVKRGFPKMKKNYRSKFDMFMDIDATHKSCPLKLQELLDADDFNYYHDIIGIGNNLNRETKQLENCFLPRCAK